MSTLSKPNHIGRKISRIRELKDMKQEALAQALGLSQQSISNIENSETIDDERLIDIAKVFGVSVEALKNFSEDSVINYFNNFYDESAKGQILNNSCSNLTFNPLDKLIEAYEENKKALRTFSSS